MRRALLDAIAAFGQDGDITAMLQAILTESNLRGVLEAPAPMYKYMSPWHFMTACLRGTEATVTATEGIEELRRFLVEDLSQGPYDFGPPNGYSEDINDWAQNQPGRWRFAYKLLERQSNGRYGGHPGIGVDVPRLYGHVGGFDRDTCASQANEVLAGGNPPHGGSPDHPGLRGCLAAERPRGRLEGPVPDPGRSGLQPLLIHAHTNTSRPL